MNIYEFHNIKPFDTVFLRCDIRDIKSGFYKVFSKNTNVDGCGIYLIGHENYQLYCGLFYTLTKYRKLKLKKLLNA